jgi:hypothetical protein
VRAIAPQHPSIWPLAGDKIIERIAMMSRVLPSCAAGLALAGCAASSGPSPYGGVGTVNGVRTYTYYDANHPGETIGSTVRTGDLQYQPRHVALATGEFERQTWSEKGQDPSRRERLCRN